MNITFLGQGFEPVSKNSVGNHLLSFLKEKKFHTFTGMSAFASEAGIFGLSEQIRSAKTNFKNLNLIVGVDQEGTSKEALEEILNLQIRSYIFYQAEAPVFHPKIYLFEGDKEVRLILGSSNLTLMGLFNNVESSLLIEFNSSEKEGNILLAELKTYYKSLFDFSDPNLFEISNIVIADFVAKGLVPDEATRKRIYSKKTKPIITPATSANGIAIPKRPFAKTPSFIPRKPKPGMGKVNDSQATNYSPSSSTSQSSSFVPATTINQQAKVLIWQKLALSKSDAQQVPSGTAVTANLKLSQARFKVNNIKIDQKTYFRDQIFNNLNWVKTKGNNKSYEEAFCQFDINILGNPTGSHTLKLSHDPVRIADQDNTPTWLHWGNAILPVNITGKTFNLYQLGKTFFIEIV